jgi:hypothetical protein
MEKIPYELKDNIEPIILSKIAEGKFLIEVQNHIDGNFLIFDDKPNE